MQDGEVTRAFEVTDDRRVVARRRGGVKLLVRKMVEEIEQRAAQQVQVARRQRLEASGRRAHRNHVLVPENPATAVRERHHPRLGEQRSGGDGQFLARGFLVLVRAGPDLAGSGHRLQRHAPLPARGARVESHAGCARVSERGRRGQQPIAGQPLLPVLERRPENLADELGARAAGVDEQVGAQAAAVLELELLEQPVFAARRTNYLAVEADHAGALGDAAQVARRESAVQVQRVAHVLRHAQRVGGEDEAVGERHRGLEAEQLERGFQAQGARLVPVVIERPALDQCAEGAVWMPAGLARRRPVGETGAEAVGALGLVDEVVLIDAELAQQFEHGGLCGFRKAGARGFARVEDMDRALSAELARQGRGGGPAGDATANNGDAPDSSIRFRHFYPL